MSDLLPPNSTAQERALDDAASRLGDVPVVVRDMWNPDTCPANLLAWLAWAFSVDEWDPAWTDAQKRATIKFSIDVHKYKGTIGAVREALAALQFAARVQEWFNQIPEAEPYTFRVLLEVDQAGVEQAAYASLLNVIDRTKNLRSHLDQIELIVKSQAGPTVAAYTNVGNEVVLSNYVPGLVVANETTICI
jgi:phage tail P2-like protein